MRFKVLATDYDGTLAHHGTVDPPTVEALERFRASGRQLVMVTGRELPELQSVFPQLDLFDLVVAENGAVLFRPSDGWLRLLADPPPAAFAEMLRSQRVHPLSVGHVIVATVEPNEVPVIQAIKELGLELQVIFNKGSVMVLPSGVNKASGLKKGLREIGLSPEDTVGVGDAENDHAFLEICACGVAVANALPLLKEHADLVTAGPHGIGVSELMDRVLKDDLADVPLRPRHREPVPVAES